MFPRCRGRLPRLALHCTPYHRLLMPPTSPAPSLRSIAVWLEPQHLPLVRETLGLIGATAVLAGSPTRGQSRALASELGCEGVDDLRRVMVEGQVELVWIVAAGAFGEGGESDAQAV